MSEHNDKKLVAGGASNVVLLRNVGKEKRDNSRSAFRPHQGYSFIYRLNAETRRNKAAANTCSVESIKELYADFHQQGVRIATEIEAGRPNSSK